MSKLQVDTIVNNADNGAPTFSSDISGGSLRLLGYPAFASTTTFKTVFTAIEA